MFSSIIFLVETARDTPQVDVIYSETRRRSVAETAGLFRTSKEDIERKTRDPERIYGSHGDSEDIQTGPGIAEDSGRQADWNR